MLQEWHSCLSAYDMWIMSKRKVIVREDFIGFAPVKDKTCPGIKVPIFKGLRPKHLDLGNLRGQVNEGASVMKGQLGGCAALIFKGYPSVSAFIVPAIH
jgi:hypothetical protein